MARFKPDERICGRFVVDKLVGTGGMSEVYRGHDSKLGDRPVAIKVLRTGPLEDPERRKPVLNEVRSLSKLNHPNIAVLYDVCSHEGADVIVMEFVEGVTLGSLLQSGRLPEAEALRYAIQITSALAYAHRQGVIHRDVKPSNIIITSQSVKLVDFGLARLRRQETHTGAEGIDVIDAEPTTVAGTPFYMAPEQLVGSKVDHRADIYSFGLVLCRMYTGFKPQPDSGVARRAVISGVLEQMPSRPARVIAERCLATNPDDRWLDTTDLLYALTVAETVPARSESDSGRTKPRWMVRAAAATAALALILLAAWWINPRGKPNADYQFAVLPPAGTSFVSLEAGGPAAISPDGENVAFVASDGGGTTTIWTRRLNALEATPLAGTEGGSHPFWSPDSRSIGFFTPGKLLRISLSGGQPRILAEAAQGRGGSWSKNGVIVFAPGYTEPLSSVSAEGGDLGRVTALEFSRGETSHRWPFFLPDGRHFLYFVRSDRPDVQGLYLGSIDGQQRTPLGSITSSAVYANSPGRSDGYLIYSQRGFLTAQRFSPSENRLLEGVFAVAQLPTPEEDTSVAPVSVSNNGIFVHGGGSLFRQALVWVDRTGREVGVISAQGRYRNPRLSPDRRRVALERLEIRSGLASVWLFDLNRDVQYRFVPAAQGAAFSPVWSPDGKTLVFAADRGNQWDLARRDATDESDVTVLRTGKVQAATDWSKDGKWLIYQEGDAGTTIEWDIGALELSTGHATTLLDSNKSEHQGQLSPDGSWLAYTSNESGRDEIYLQRFPSLANKVLVSAAGGTQPKWRPDGRELFYVGANQEMMSVEIDLRSTPPTLAPGQMLFRARMAPAAGILSLANYDVDSQGGRFLISAPPQLEHLHQQITVLVNWLAQISAD